MPRIFVAEADEILDKEYPVLNHGFVRLVDYLGGDERIVAAARVSYGKGTKSLREDARLIEYLVQNDHTSPFEQVILTYHVKLPIFLARQWVRHRTARLNEVSGRYSVMKDDFYIPSPESIRGQSITNRQARSEERLSQDVQDNVMELIERDQKTIYKNYEDLLGQGVARELARINLPLSIYTEWYWQIDLHNLFHFLKLRLDNHAQWEMQEYAKVIGELAKRVAPIAFRAFEDHTLLSKQFSRSKIEKLRKGLLNLDDSVIRRELLAELSD